MDVQKEIEIPALLHTDHGYAAQLGVMLITDDDTGKPLVGVRFIGEKEGSTFAPVFYRMYPATAQELGTTLVGAAATASLFESTYQYISGLQEVGKDAEAQAILNFAEWLSKNEGA